MSKNTNKDTSYLPVAWEYLETIKQAISQKTKGKIFYFDKENSVAENQGIIMEIKEKNKQGVFLIMDDGHQIRIDQIITLYGKIGAAYDIYNAFANACMECTGGYSKEELEDM